MNTILALILSIVAQDASCIQPIQTLTQLDSAFVATQRELKDSPESRQLRFPWDPPIRGASLSESSSAPQRPWHAPEPRIARAS